MWTRQAQQCMDDVRVKAGCTCVRIFAGECDGSANNGVLHG
jgi:hypothetical protein